MSENIKLGAIFTMIVRDENGDVKRKTEPFNNLVLNSGLDRMGTGGWITGVAVGTGNSVPTPTQTSLESLIAWTSTIQVSGQQSLQSSAEPYYWQWEITYRFGQGVAAGNLSEVGVGWGASSMWNRALIKDVNGNPTTITVLPNEFLDVLVQVRIYPNLNDVVKTVELVDDAQNIVSTHTVTIRPYLSTSSPYNPTITPGEAIAFYGGVPARMAFASGGMGDIFTLPTGSFNSNVQGMTHLPYVPGSHKRVGYTNSSISQDNNTHRSVLVPSRLGYFKFEYDPPITKNNTQTLNHNFELSWGRYEPT